MWEQVYEQVKTICEVEQNLANWVQFLEQYPQNNFHNFHNSLYLLRWGMPGYQVGVNLPGQLSRGPWPSMSCSFVDTMRYFYHPHPLPSATILWLWCLPMSFYSFLSMKNVELGAGRPAVRGMYHMGCTLDSCSFSNSISFHIHWHRSIGILES